MCDASVILSPFSEVGAGRSKAVQPPHRPPQEGFRQGVIWSDGSKWQPTGRLDTVGAQPIERDEAYSRNMVSMVRKSFEVSRRDGVRLLLGGVAMATSAATSVAWAGAPGAPGAGADGL